MTFFQAIILGIVQGLTEFLPVSSSAHLVLVPFLLNWKLDPTQAFIFDVLVQLGTLAAVIVFFRKDLLAIIQGMLRGIKDKEPLADADGRLGWMIVLATIPAGLAGLFLKNKVEAAFNSPVATAVMLFVTALLLTCAEIWSRRAHQIDQVGPREAVVMGLFQAASIFPGISRSGATISGGLFSGLKRQATARFSFLMSIPIMLAAGLLAVLDLVKMPSVVSVLPVVLVGFVAAAVIGYLAIRWFLDYLKSKSLFPFALYCAVLSIVVIFVVYAR